MSVVTIALICPVTANERKVMLPSDGIETEDLITLLSAIFPQAQILGNIVGLHDLANDVDIPLALLAQKPSLSIFTSKTPLVLLLQQQQQNVPLPPQTAAPQLVHPSTPPQYNNLSSSISTSSSSSSSSSSSKGRLYSEDIAEVAFRQLDLNGDNLIHREEMIEYMSLAFGFLCSASQAFAKVSTPPPLSHILHLFLILICEPQTLQLLFFHFIPPIPHLHINFLFPPILTHFSFHISNNHVFTIHPIYATDNENITRRSGSLHRGQLLQHHRHISGRMHHP